jgi:ATP-GRASP peptide maturase of grasp-with-spasm system
MGKIVIISEDSDTTTTDIMLWILHYGTDVVRINRDDKTTKISRVCKEEVVIETENNKITIHPDDLVWSRRSGLFSIYPIQETDPYLFQTKVFKFNEQRDLWISFYWWILLNCRYYGSPFAFTVNKIHVLQIAEQTGILVPEWIVTSYKKDISSFLSRHEKVALKPFNTFMFSKEEDTIKNLTKCISMKYISNIPDNFDPLIVQKYIDKKYEIRSFLFNDTFYSMAIFSQNDEKTQVDFRNYNEECPNREMPFKLNSKYEKKLLQLSKKLNLMTGSFDILIDQNDCYYFLEVNPVGQFGMVSYPCNYYIERNIAKHLIKLLQDESHVAKHR